MLQSSAYEHCYSFYELSVIEERGERQDSNAMETIRIYQWERCAFEGEVRGAFFIALINSIHSFFGEHQRDLWQHSRDLVGRSPELYNA